MRRGRAKMRRIATTTRKTIAPLLPPLLLLLPLLPPLPPLLPLPSLLLLPLPPPQAAGRHASFATTASDQALAAVAAAWRSGLQRCTVAAAADSRMPSLTPVFSCFLSVCLFHVAQNTMFHLFRPRSTYVLCILLSGIPAGIPESGIPDQINLALE